MKRYAVLVTGDPTPYTKRKYGDYAKLFLDLLEEPNETWDVFDVRTGVFPAQPEAFAGMVVTGSSSDAHDDLDWILRLMAFIRHVEAKRIPILGICFGHQVLARALGGVSQRNPSGWEMGIHEMSLLPGFDEIFPEYGGRKTARILEIHQDHVATLPSDAKLLVTSPGTPIQAFSVSRHVLGIQGHPEFNRDIVRDLIDSRVDSGMIEDSVAQEGRTSLDLDLDAIFWRDILLRFLKGE